MRTLTVVMAGLLLSGCGRSTQTDPGVAAARDAMMNATEYMRSISTNGGYVGLYSADLTERYGEALYEEAGADEIWVQPPGTPTVGETWLAAWRATGDGRYLDAAREVGLALAWAQRREGGWDHRCDVSHFREGAPPEKLEGRCTFDDNISQGALTFLIHLDDAVDEPWLTEAVDLALDHLLRAQFDNGAWPQWYPLIGGYHDYWTFNDNTINDCIRVMMLAACTYDDPRYKGSVRLAGDFIIVSQHPEPQAGWAQQYSHDMQPAWARTFEPIGLCSAVTARNIRTLIDIHLYTGDGRYLDPIPKAIAWLDTSKVGNDLWPRFNELGTNLPIYGDRDGEVHYTLEEISEERRKGYSWQGTWPLGPVAEYRRLVKMGAEAYAAERERSMTGDSKEAEHDALEPRAAAVVAAMEPEGRWLDPESGMLRTRDFVENMRVLIRYVELSKE